jgi:hypothetical protein
VRYHLVELDLDGKVIFQLILRKYVLKCDRLIRMKSGYGPEVEFCKLGNEQVL